MSNMVVATNVLALNSHRNMKLVGDTQSRASSRLSSGYRVNTAADDAAGLAISEKMRAQIRGLDMASKNGQDGISLVQTAEGGMQEIDNMIQRIRELVVQVSNDTNEHNETGSGDRQKIQDEISSLVAEIDSMAERVEFNKKKVINGSYADVAGQLVGAKSELTIAQQAGNGLSATSIAAAAACFGTAFASVQALNADSATIASQVSDRANSLSNAKASLEALVKVASGGDAPALASLGNVICIAAASLSDFAASEAAIEVLRKVEQAKVDENRPLVMVDTSLLVSALETKVAALSNAKGTGETLYFQLGANAKQGIDLNIGSVKTNLLGIGNGTGKTNIDVLKKSGAETTGYLDVLDSALSYVTSERSKLGATQNRLEYTIKSLDISSENLVASESRIRDADMAKEMMRLTQANVLQQAATSMLAQGNQAPQNVLQLLR